MEKIDRKNLIETVEYELSQLIDLLEGAEGEEMARLRIMLEAVRSEAERSS